MKVAQINCVYGYGSTGKIVRNIHCALQINGFESVVFVPIVRSKFINEEGVFSFSNKFHSTVSAVYRRSTGHQYDGAFIQTKKLIKKLKQEKPDVVHVHCINGNNINNYMLMEYLAENHIPTVLTVHAEFPYTGGCAHAYECMKWMYGCGKCPIWKEATGSLFGDGTARCWKKRLASYSCFSDDLLTIVGVSPWEAGRAAKSPMLSRFHITAINNGVDTNVFHFRSDSCIAQKIKAENPCYWFHVTAHFSPDDENDLKGGKYIIQLAEKLKGTDIKIVVAANTASVSILPDNVLYIGHIESQEDLASLYSLADLTLITSRKETFSMPTAESLCCGTPVIGFEAGGPESIAIYEYTRFVTYGNVECLYRSAIELSNICMDLSKEEIADIAQEKYSNERMIAEYMDIYRHMYANDEHLVQILK